ncbi:hemerythrin family protein [Rhodoferax sp.]|uniref:bacteriohemerythrin n=1 Tax=Rhodoferax sp. TaxID=50421 RepID=UPI0025D78D7C|nr:hemerythrin family protein [Rhodoferax sp.]
MGSQKGQSEAIPTTPFRIHGQIEYRVKGRILHTTARGPFREIVEAIPATVTGFIQRLAQQGRWGQIVIFQQSALMPAASLQNFAVYLKLRYVNSEIKPAVALVLEPGLEGGELMAPQFLRCYLEAGIKVQVFEDYVSALNWVESEISQFSTRLQWNDSFKIGDKDIDEQHRELFHRATHVLAATSHEGQVIAAMRLFQYMRAHLSHEEELMRRLQYPDYEAHALEHHALIVGLNTISLRIASENLVKADLERFIGDWFLRHMETADTDLARFANATR